MSCFDGAKILLFAHTGKKVVLFHTLPDFFLIYIKFFLAEQKISANMVTTVPHAAKA